MHLLSDYTPLPYTVPSVHLRFDLTDPHAVRVRARLHVVPQRSDLPILLNGDGLTPLSVTYNDLPVPYTLHDNGDLELPPLPGPTDLDIETRIDPSANTALEGLYRSNGLYCTQCEPHGFRRIMFFPDRPDVSSVYTVEIIGSDPILLSNGNLLERETLPDGRHRAVWHDPFAKPSYLFALAAGDLRVLEDTFRTRSGRDILLQIYTEEAYADRCAFAMDSLKRAMAWDETAYGLEYDLDRFMILAVSDFNMGAMENKGLNIFNIKYIAASVETATDTDYEHIESVVAHEYFHNYTGNRVTCRDWFQLCLKEGLTVFRDQQFSAQMRGAVGQRLDNVAGLRTAQFPEDAGPLKHPVRPDRYGEVNNLYTSTVYEKGAEICRMLQTVLGEQAFAAGVGHYLRKHDGGAGTVEDFLSALSESSGVDVSPFLVWYTRAGTPVLQAERTADGVRIRQSMPDPDDAALRPIPILWGAVEQESQLHLLTEREAVLPITGVPSLLRGFSAPVRLECAYSDDELLHLLNADRDPFNRLEAAEVFAIRLLTAADASDARADAWCDALLVIAADPERDADSRARALRLPPLARLMQEGAYGDPQALYAARERLSDRLAARGEALLRRLAVADPEDVAPDPDAAGRRALRNAALAFVNRLERLEGTTAAAIYAGARCMTDRMAALTALVHGRSPHRAAALDDFFHRTAHDANTLDKWFSVQAGSPNTDAAALRALAAHPHFNLENPNRARSLFGVFAHANLTQFCTPDGFEAILESVVQLDRRNPQGAARTAQAFEILDRLPPERAAAALTRLRTFTAEHPLSKETADILGRITGAAAA